MESIIKILYLFISLLLFAQSNQTHISEIESSNGYGSIFDRSIRNMRVVPCKKSSQYFTECNESFQKLLVTLKQLYRVQAYNSLKNSANKDTFGR